MIFLNPQRLYDALDSSRCLDIHEGYGVGPQACQLLQTYWRRLTIVARVSGYYWAAFQGYRGVTQGDPLSPTIFNMVVDAVVRQWVGVMVQDAEERGECGQEDMYQASLLYVDNGMVSLPNP